MIKISKSLDDPFPLQHFKEQTQTIKGSACNYDLLQNPDKNDYKMMLLQEQHYLCAYCNRNLDEFVDNGKLHLLKIEHWFPQSLCIAEPNFNTPLGRDVAHENMLLVCPGKNVNPNFTHCDSSRTEGAILTIKPQDSRYNFSNVFTYEAGRLKTENSHILEDVNNELCLNEDMLINRRNIVLDTFIKSLMKNKLANKRALLNKYSNPDKHNKLSEYCTAIIHFLNVQLNRE